MTLATAGYGFAAARFCCGFVMSISNMLVMATMMIVMTRTVTTAYTDADRAAYGS